MAENAGTHEVFRHLTADRARLYRAILDIFVRAKRQFALHLRPSDIEKAVDPDLAAEEQIGNALAQLVDWGNLEAHPDTADVTTVEEFYRPRHLYQLTHAGEAAERALAFFDEALRQQGELQAVALADIRLLLDELIEIAAGDPIDAAKAHRAAVALRGRFDDLTTKAQAFMGSLQRTVDLHGLTVEALLAYKQSLIDYLERFIAELLLATAEIADRIVRVEALGVARLLAVVAGRELADALEPTATDRATAEAGWVARWRGLRAWFLPQTDAPSQAEVLRARARSAIPALLAAVAGINDRRVARSDRAADLRTLALWFAEADSDADAHRLWRACFALSPARHLTVDDETLAQRDEVPVSSQTSWLDAPPIGITPRLRETGRHSRPGAPTRVIDRTSERAVLARLMDEETLQIERARQRLATGRPARLSELGALSRAEFDLLLDLIGEAIARRVIPSDIVEACSTDGSLIIRLEPPRDGSVAYIETETGRLAAPDFLVTIRDAFGAEARVARERSDERAAS